MNLQQIALKQGLQIFLGFLFIVFLLGFIRVPYGVASVTNSVFGQMVIVAVAIWLVMYEHPVLGVLGVVVAYELISKSSFGEILREKAKWSKFDEQNQFPYTLEQEMVKKMTNLQFNDYRVKAPYRPSLSDIHGAEYLNGTN